ncbi:Sec39-domain-containing protein [Cucurbitaria berberidis CBS 394.84]|uniref:Sec39-domain-containing protein n=1 Tax=Cucurbitaria berberidis CBS 394.84 TaxID=1168544 RepID=A0A9P4GCK4_9PLEO|nr:Sec39-domain-containing protein [Cucurbitaria berberidis CBS 394.84]KAF1843152.1 Sec39-domain-containing protein [Cucurbitaria berberidis CBS 394.84]
MDALSTELEELSQTYPSEDCHSRSDTTIKRWEHIFHFNRAQAENALETHYNNLSRLTVSDELWIIVREEQEALGHDKESYAFSLSQQCDEARLSRQSQEKNVVKKQHLSKERWLFRLTFPLDSSDKIQAVAHLAHPLEILIDEEVGTAQFVQIDSASKAAIETYLKPTTPTFIALQVAAEKQLSDTSIAPTLGIEATLPQYRLDTIPRPQQDEYPVPYFFYGTLAEPARLMAMLGLSGESMLKAAVVRGGRIKMCDHRYRALVDGCETDVVHGVMYMVESKEHEDALGLYEGRSYEVVRFQYAAEANMGALRALTALRDADFPLELVLSILLTYLPEETDPPSYLEYLNELATDSRTPGDDPAAPIATSPVDELSNSRAKKRRRALELLPVVQPLYAAETELDLLTHFLIHRAHRIDSQTGLLDVLPQLLVPFLGHSEYLRTWFISTVLPLLRLSYEYYPQSATGSLDEFARLKGKRAIDYQLSNVCHAGIAETHNVARDLKGVVAPWICGANDRKRRRITGDGRRGTIAQEQAQEPDDWACLFQWLLYTSKDDLALVTTAFTEWDGPEDMDLGGYEEGRDYVGDEQQGRLEMKYAQTALACLYLIDKSDVDSLQSAHSLLRRISELLNCDLPPDLNVGVDSLPSYNLKDPLLQDSTTSLLREERLLESENAITKPGRESVRILELIVFSACVLTTLQHPMSVREVAQMSLRDDYSEQFSLLQKILHTLSSGPKTDSHQWTATRSKLLWLWNWGTDQHDNDRQAQGIFGMLDSKTVEVEILKALLESSHYPLAVELYIKPGFGQQPLLSSDVEEVVLSSVMHHYDNASNGNRTRGGMKRAADIFTAFTPHFPSSARFQRTKALLAATHAMSFYSLILQHGVPFQPVNIRVSSNPLSLIVKLLSQNRGSYTKLDDLISIGQNLVVAMPSTIMDENSAIMPLDAATVERKKAAAERRVIGMAIEAALEEDDFETAYSYVVNRATPPTPSPTPSSTPSLSSQRFSFGSLDSDNQDDDAEDVAWRAALRAGRYSSSLSTSNSWSQAGTPRPDLRRLEQRMELLSQALLLAPPNHLEEVLSVWQQCEAEMTDLLAHETAVEMRFNDAADRKLPGAFDLDTLTVQPQRREVGRGAVEEAPMGLFDVARGAAAAFSKTAFPLHGSAQAATKTEQGSMRSSSRVSLDFSDSGSMSGHDERVRKRDMVASAATGALASGSGALASGLGWMLGAKPVAEPER